MSLWNHAVPVFFAALLMWTGGISGAEPEPSLELDFSALTGKDVKEKRSGLTFRIGADAEVRSGALTVTPGTETLKAADPAAFRAWAKSRDTREIAVSFWIRFDKGFFGAARENRADFALFDCAISPEKRIEVTVHTAKTELMSPVVMRSSFEAEYGRWYHVEFSYSMNSRRYALYIDGKFQMENDSLLIPRPCIRELASSGTFRGAVRNVKFYEAALTSEELALTLPGETDFSAVEKDIAVAGKSANAYLKAWAAELGKRLASLKELERRNDLSVAAYKRLAKDAANARTLAESFAAPGAAGMIRDKAVTVYEVPATSQEMYLPKTLPSDGKLTDHIELVMAQDEYETASIVVIPFVPVKNFTVKLTEPRNGAHALKNTDIKIVKRWFRAGGAWLTYHVDFYMRAFVPDMLLNDENLVRTNEFRRTNEVLFHYPGGDRYTDVSEFLYDRKFMSRQVYQFFRDAPELQPVTFREAGRNRQYVITFRAEKDTPPGFYEGRLQLLADGRDAGSVLLTVRVLPFALPQPAAYENQDSVYLSHVNSWDGDEASLVNGMKFNMMHLTDVAKTAHRIRMCVKNGYPLKEIFSISSPKVKFDGPEDKLTPEILEQMGRMTVNPILRWQKMLEKISPERDYRAWMVNSSESGWYGTISRDADMRSRVLEEKTHLRLFSHGMSDALRTFSPGIYLMNSSSYLAKEEAPVWHSFGGKNINYAAPFPGPENPNLMRRVMGLEMYKHYGMDGHMMHGYVGLNLNEFSKWPGGDGDYRGFEMCFRTADGVINKLAMIGYREGFDDVRYATLMKREARKALASSDVLVKREAARQLAWLERVNGQTMNMDDFRTQVQYRIMVLRDLIRARGGK